MKSTLRRKRMLRQVTSASVSSVLVTLMLAAAGCSLEKATTSSPGPSPGAEQIKVRSDRPRQSAGTTKKPMANPIAIPQDHPYIWSTAADKKAILDRIANDEKAAELKRQLHERIDAAVARHVGDPGAILKTVPAIGRDTRAHRSLFNTVVFSAVLYYLTEDEKYAQFSADILNDYIMELSEKDARTTTIVGKHFEDGRWTYPNVGITYDLIHPFLSKKGTKVFSGKTGKHSLFDNGVAQKVIRNIASNAVGEFTGRDRHHGGVVSNHHLLTSKGALYTILCVADKAERERLFKIYWETGTREQASLKNTVIPMFNHHKQGILPESTSYGGMSPLGVLWTIDRIKPELNAISDNLEILEGRFIFPQLTHPNGLFIRYGDSKRYNGSPAGQMRQVRRIAIRKGYRDMQRRAEAFLKLYPITGKPRIKEYSSCQGLLQIPPPPFDPDTIDEAGEIKRTVLVKHAGIALVRNYVEKDNKIHGLNGYIGGAHYVHSHCTGIGMELYGGGYIMAPSAGMPPAVKDRRSPPHANYARLYAGNNTVIVNGTSHGLQKGAWKSKSNVWQNNAINIACEPRHLKEPVSEYFGFASQFLKDTVNDCTQQRTLAVIRTSPISGYYLDIFRSLSNKANKFHDYIYHNLGDDTVLTDDQGTPFQLSPTDKYDNDIGDLVKSPGWRFFEEEKTTEPTSEAVRATFVLKHDDRFMHMFVPAGVKREYTKALGPPTREAKNGYVTKKTQILAIRQYGKAWDRPFVVILEPSLGEKPTVVSAAHLFKEGTLAAIKVNSVIDGITITDVIIENDRADASTVLPDLNIEFKGRFAIVRTLRKGDRDGVSLYIGEGTELRYGEHKLSTNKKKHGFKAF